MEIMIVMIIGGKPILRYLMKVMRTPRSAARPATMKGWRTRRRGNSFTAGQAPGARLPPDRFEIIDAHSSHALNERDHGCDKRDVVRTDETSALSQRMRSEVAVTSPPVISIAFFAVTDNARFDKLSYGDEETDEEEDGRPFNGFHRLFPELWPPPAEAA